MMDGRTTAHIFRCVCFLHDRSFMFRDGKQYYEEQCVIPLLTASPMSHVRDIDEGGEDKEATWFDAETQIRHLEDLLHFYGCSFHEWFLCSICDNCNLNKSIARLLDVSHIGCLSHKLNLEVNAMVSRHVLLQHTMTKFRIRCWIVSNSWPIGLYC